MADVKNKDLILETIDQLRKRKARPDLERICHMLERRYGVTASQTEADVERLVAAEIVIKVEYKGSTSYRNAAKWGRRNPCPGHVLNTNDVSRCLREAVRQTAAARTRGVPPNKGASLEDVEKYLLANNAHARLTKGNLEVWLMQEVNSCRLKKLPSGNYTLYDATENNSSSSPAAPAADGVGRSGKQQAAQAAASTVEAPPATTANNGVPPPFNFSFTRSKGPRPSNKRKRFKKTHGPDFVEDYDSSFEEKTDPKCDYCLRTASCNKNGQREELLICKDCNAKAHPSCMDYTEELSQRSRMSPWQCIDCKTCVLCKDAEDGSAMLFCDSCDKGYHMECHEPKVNVKPTGKWVCQRCVNEADGNNGKGARKEQQNQNNCNGRNADPMDVAEIDSTNHTIDGAPGLPTPCDSPVPEEENKKMFSPYVIKDGNINFLGLPRENGKHEFDVPDASEWSIEDVVEYFNAAGFAEQALSFKEQEIDGKSLLLMKRSDVLTGLSIKLGPALKIYNHVKKLQMRLDDSFT